MTLTPIGKFADGDRVWPALGVAHEDVAGTGGVVVGWDVDYSGYIVQWDDGDRDTFMPKQLAREGEIN